MNQGFFSSSETSTTRYIPPRPNFLFPAPEPEKVVAPPDLSNSRQLLMDIECYVNYFLIKFLRLSDNALIEFEHSHRKKLDFAAQLELKALLQRYEIVTFHGNAYDIPILKYALKGATNKELKQATDLLIKGGIAVWKFEKDYNLSELRMRGHIDCHELLPGFVSLKIHGARLHCELLQDLPIEEQAELTEQQMDDISLYCGNDLKLTKLVLLDLLPQIQLRRDVSEKYQMDVMSKSDAQIAEAIIKSELEKVKGHELKKPEVEPGQFFYRAPDFIRFASDQLNKVLEIVTTKPFIVRSNGQTEMPQELKDLKIKMGVSTYKMGMGGLHSSEKTTFYNTDDKYTIHDWDVTSFYPWIILILGLFPRQLGKVFLTIYRMLVEERVLAKKTGDKVKADAFKITVNGTFGKTGSPYSILYEPSMMIQITVTGQLSLLMLIEMMEREGIRIVSGNTDGIVMKCPRDKEGIMRSTIRRWERMTGFGMEETQYVGIYSRDVNNYMAFKKNGEVKMKGCFSPPDIGKNPENEICVIAMIDYIKYGTPFETTIRNCKDITKFLTVRSVKGGAYLPSPRGEVPHHKTKEELVKMAGFYEIGPDAWRHEAGQGEGAVSRLEDAYKEACRMLRDKSQDIYLGKAIRWYHARGVKGAIYSREGHKVAMTDGAKPMMTLDGTFPDDIDYDWYVSTCTKLFQ